MSAMGKPKSSTMSAKMTTSVAVIMPIAYTRLENAQALDQ